MFSVSARRPGSTPAPAAASRAAPTARPSPEASALASVFRRWAKAARTTASKRRSSARATRGAASGARRSTADSTFGGGRKAPGGTRIASSTRQWSWTCTERLPYVLPPGAAATRSATSRWSIRAIRSIARGARASAVRIEVPTLYGRLPTTSARPPAGRASDVQSHARASAFSTSIAGNAPRSRSISARSTSSASTLPARRASSPVSAPCPGPISTTRSAGVGATRSTIARAMPGSRRKCWPRARRLSPGTRSGREVARQRGVHLARARLGGGAVAAVVDDVVGELDLLGQRHLARDAARAVGGVGVARDEAGALRGLVGDDDDETVHVFVAARLDHHGRVEDHDALEALARQRLQPRVEAGANRRVQDRLEPLPPRGLREHDGGHLLAIERAVRGEHVAELANDRGQSGLAGRHDLARQLIGVDHDAAQAAEDLRDRALARGDPAGEADEQEAPRGRRHTCDQSSPDFTSTTTGTSSGSAASMISRASVSTAGTSARGASKSSSSCTWSSIRAFSPRSTRAARMRTIAVLIMSLAVPCTGAFMAMRSAALRATGLPERRSGR